MIKCIFLSIRKSLIIVSILLLPIFFSIYTIIQGHITPYTIEMLLSPLTIIALLILHEIGHYIALPRKYRSNVVFNAKKGACLMIVECNAHNIILSIIMSLILPLLLPLTFHVLQLRTLSSLTLTSSIILPLIDILINISQNEIDINS